MNHCNIITAREAIAAFEAIGAAIKVWRNPCTDKAVEITVRGAAVWENSCEFSANGKLTERGAEMLENFRAEKRSFDVWYASFGRRIGTEAQVLAKHCFGELTGFGLLPAYSEDVGRYYTAMANA